MKRTEEEDMEICMCPGSRCGSVQVTEAGGLASFLHKGTKLELLPGQKTYMLKRKRARVSWTKNTQDFKASVRVLT